jgi:four helix bundle protein
MPYYTLTREAAFARDRGLVDQVRRAAVSIMSNVAEGFERGSTTEFIQFLHIAKGSCGEVRVQLQIAHDQQYVAKEEFDRLHALCRCISGMISNFIAHLQRSDYRGEKMARPRRQIDAAREKRIGTLRAAQLANMKPKTPDEPPDP